MIRAYLGARWKASPPLLAEIDDATQDVFVECFKEDGALARVDPDGGGGFRTFLFAVVRNIAQRRVELLRLRFVEGQPTREIAQRWNMKPAAIQYEYKCARDEFQAALVDVVRQHDPAGDIEQECARLLALLG